MKNSNESTIFMTIKLQNNYDSNDFFVTDYRTQIQDKNNKNKLTYKQLTIAERDKLISMLRSGHRLSKTKKNLGITKNKGSKKYFYYMNPYPWIELIEATLRIIESFGQLPTHAITIIDRKWQTSIFDFMINIRAIRAKLCQEFNGKDILVMIELAFLDNGIIAVHCQGVLFGGITNEEIKRLETRFHSGIKDIPTMEKGFVAVARTQLVGMAAYMIKPPTYRYKKPQYKGANKTNRLSNRECFKLFRKMRTIHSKPITYFDMMIGVGAGVQLKADIMNFLGYGSYIKSEVW